MATEKVVKEGLQVDPVVEQAEAKRSPEVAEQAADQVSTEESVSKIKDDEKTEAPESAPELTKKKSSKKEAKPKKKDKASKGKKDSKGKKKGGNVYFSKVSPLDVAMVIRHLSMMLKSGMPISDSLEVITAQASDQRIKDALEDIMEQVGKGTSMAEAMEDHPKIFPHIIRSVIRVGEQGATLEKNLLFLAEFLKQSYELNRKVKGAMTYPMIIFGITVVEMLGVIFIILPKLDSLFSSFEDIPAFTQFLLDASDFITHNIFLIVGVIVVAYIIQMIFFKTKAGVRIKEWIALNFPIIKELNKKNTLTSFARTLGILLESGIPIVKAIEISSDTVENSYYGETLKKVYESVQAGNTLADSLEKHEKYFPITFTRMIKIGEETGTLEENLLFLHGFYLEEVTDMSNNLATLLEPILLVFIGAMIGLLALTIISPIYQLTGSIN